MDGTKSGEPIFLVKSGDKVTLHFCDCTQNSPGEGMVAPLRWMGFAGGPKVVPAFKFLFTADRDRLRSDFGRLAETPGTRCGRHLRAVNRREECAGASAADRTLVMMGRDRPKKRPPPWWTPSPSSSATPS